MSHDSRDPLEPFVAHVCFQSGAALPLSITSDNMATWSKSFKKEKKRARGGEGVEEDRSDRTIKGGRRQGRESRKGLTVRENVRLIEASFAQLFLVAARHCSKRLPRMGSRCGPSLRIARQ